MRKLTFVPVLILLLVFNYAAPVFPDGMSADAQFSGIVKDIPNFWWDGGWDKLQDLQDFVINNPGEPLLCAKAQYYIGCYYYSKQKYQKAIDEYEKVPKLYPSITAECSRARFEIAQIKLNCLNDPDAAISEYRKIVSDYPNDYNAPVAQLMIGRAYIKIKNPAQAKIEFQKLIDSYPSANSQRAEGYAELGDAFMAEGSNKEALSCFKKAFIACPASDPALMTHTMDKIYEGLRNLDGSVARANQFIKYQKYGPAGEDKKLGTPDDLTDPLAEF